MEQSSFSEVEVIKFSPKLDKQDMYDTEEEKINTSNSYSVPTSSMYYSEEEESPEPELKVENKSKKVLTIANPDPKSSSSQEVSSKAESIKNKILPDTIDISLQNNINDNTINVSPISKNSKILPTSLTSDDKRKSLGKKSDIDASSVVVEINDEDEEIIEIEDGNRTNDSFVVVDQSMDAINGTENLKEKLEMAENLKKKLEMTENRISLTTTADFTYVNQNQLPRNSADLSMPENSDIVNTNLKRLTDTTSVPPVIGDKTNEITTNEVDKAAADLSNNDHRIAIEEDDEDNTCAICLIETEKPTDIENLNNKDGSNETVVAPTKEDIDNYECKLHCMHKFHYSCIAQWLERNQNCPICREKIKHYEIEAIEKRFDISIKVKEDPLPLVVPHYNTTFDFDTELTVDLVKEYIDEHLPYVNFNVYVYTKFFFYYIGFLIFTILGVILVVDNFIRGKENLYFVTYVIVIVLIIEFIILTVQFIVNICRKRFVLFMICQPGLSTVFYGFISVLFILLLTCMNFLIDTKDLPFSIEKVYIVCIAIFFGIMMAWSCVEAYTCYNIYKEDDRRHVDADVSRRNQEIIERSRREEAEERAEFERNFSHLND
ncbi:hypothetical protein PIROE2DRAFT_58468 [Piromyces sp. E2]|nr:hypothetical protein PIROE2DRAFT_58468 [Piromyces sp. E2]|eukprot:OUM67874.1 hypothetical protein PIROE2DRAFT_58468 [Piromyces sp. E2]